MLVDRTETAPLLVARIVDDTDAVITGITAADANLTVSVLGSGSAAFANVTLTAGTLGTYASNTWAEFGDGIYQLCLDSTDITPGGVTVVRVTYGTNDPQYDTLVARGGSAHTPADVAAVILANPANLLTTNATGQVQASNIDTGGAATTGGYVERIVGSTEPIQLTWNAPSLTTLSFEKRSGAAWVATTGPLVATYDYDQNGYSKYNVTGYSSDASTVGQIVRYRVTDGTDTVEFTLKIIADVEASTTASLATYDAPTRAEATADKDEILASFGTGVSAATGGYVERVFGSTEPIQLTWSAPSLTTLTFEKRSGSAWVATAGPLVATYDYDQNGLSKYNVTGFGSDITAVDQIVRYRVTDGTDTAEFVLKSVGNIDELTTRAESTADKNEVLAAITAGGGSTGCTSARWTYGQDETSIRVLVKLVDAAGADIPSILFSDPLLEVQTLSNSGTGFVSKTLVTTTASTWVANGWVYVDGGFYEYGLEDSQVVPNGRAVIRVRYNAGDWQYTTVQFDATGQIDMNQATPGGSTTGAQLDLAGTTASTTGTPIEAIDIFPNSLTFADTSSSLTSGTFYTGAQWTIVFRPLTLIPAGEEVVFALKTNKDSDLDTASILEVEFVVPAVLGGNTTTVTRLNGVANGSTTLATMTYETNTEDATTYQITMVIADDITSQISAATYDRGLKRVGTSEVYLDDQMPVVTPVTRAIAQ
ncbi:MAG: hypothetical protein AAGJ40_09300 [Planctomycetota bacterium]